MNSCGPDVGRLGVLRDAVRGIADEAGDVDPFGTQSHALGEEGPELPDLDVLEVVAETPAAEHLEEGRVSAVADLLDVLHAQAGLAVRQSGARGVILAEQVRQQGLHAAAGEQRRGVVLRNQRSARDDRRAPARSCTRGRRCGSRRHSWAHSTPDLPCCRTRSARASPRAIQAATLVALAFAGPRGCTMVMSVHGGCALGAPRQVQFLGPPPREQRLRPDGGKRCSAFRQCAAGCNRYTMVPTVSVEHECRHRHFAGSVEACR